jgi:peptide/nickel transport system permease protein
LLGFLTTRIARLACVLFSVSVLCFIGFELAPGDFFEDARLTSNLSAETIEALRQKHGLNESLPSKYGFWKMSVVRGNWGESLTYVAPVWPILRTRAKNTLLLSLTATIAAWVSAIRLCLHASLAGAHVRSFTRVALSFVNAVPEILVACVLLLFAAKTGFLPISGMTSSIVTAPMLWETATDLIRHMALPVDRLPLEATLQRDLYMVLGAPMASSAILVIGNLVAEVLLYIAVPRIRQV